MPVSPGIPSTLAKDIQAIQERKLGYAQLRAQKRIARQKLLMDALQLGVEGTFGKQGIGGFAQGEFERRDKAQQLEAEQQLRKQQLEQQLQMHQESLAERERSASEVAGIRAEAAAGQADARARLEASKAHARSKLEKKKEKGRQARSTERTQSRQAEQASRDALQKELIHLRGEESRKTNEAKPKPATNAAALRQAEKVPAVAEGLTKGRNLYSQLYNRGIMSSSEMTPALEQLEGSLGEDTPFMRAATFLESLEPKQTDMDTGSQERFTPRALAGHDEAQIAANLQHAFEALKHPATNPGKATLQEVSDLIAERLKGRGVDLHAAAALGTPLPHSSASVASPDYQAPQPEDRFDPFAGVSAGFQRAGHNIAGGLRAMGVMGPPEDVQRQQQFDAMKQFLESQGEQLPSLAQPAQPLTSPAIEQALNAFYRGQRRFGGQMLPVR